MTKREAQVSSLLTAVTAVDVALAPHMKQSQEKHEVS